MRIVPNIASVALIALVSACGYGTSGQGDESAARSQEPPAGGPTSADPAARALADSVVAALGGWPAWEKARFLEFTFVVALDGVERRRTTHRWDRFTGDVRMEGVDREGKPFVVVWNERTRQGQARLDGADLAGEDLAKALERANGVLVNDCYWLLMPFKLHDPGVHLADQGVRDDTTGKSWRVIALSFDENTGLTSKDRYWVYVDPASARIGRWDYILEGSEPDATPSTFAWQGWEERGGIWLALEKPSADGHVVIRFEGVIVSHQVPEGAFNL